MDKSATHYFIIKGKYLTEEKLTTQYAEMLNLLKLINPILQEHHAKQKDDWPLYAVNGYPITYGTLRAIRNLINEIEGENNG